MASTWKVIETVFLVQVGILILFGNSLVILAFIKGRRNIRTYTNYFVVNLAICDLLVGCLSLPFWISVVMELTKENDALFKFFLLLDICFGATSILSLTAISLERVFAVRYPARHFNLTRRPFYVIIALTWICGFFICALRFLVKATETYTIIVLIAAFVIPLCVIIASYMLIFSTARRLMATSNRARNLSRELQVAKTISVIIGLFVICWMPFFIINPLFVFCDDWYDKSTCLQFELDYYWLVSVAKALHYCNSMMNFFVYAVRSPDFRETFKVMVFNRCNTNKLRQGLRTFSQSYRLRSPSKRTLDANNGYLTNDTISYNASPRILRDESDRETTSIALLE